MLTAVRFGPKDHGRLVTEEQLQAADYLGGYDYEVIFGRLYVSPAPNREHDVVEKHIYNQIYVYSVEHPEVIGYVTDRARVFVPGEQKTTAPEPDLAVYAEDADDWRDEEPFIVGEVLRGEDVDKDLFRNVDLYLRVPSIREYWIFDIREEFRRPKLLVHRRTRGGWEVREWPPEATYETPLLPGLKLQISLPPRPTAKRRQTRRS